VSNLIRDETGEEPSDSSTGWWRKRGVGFLENLIISEFLLILFDRLP
jgi:hypothetical protein